MRHWYALRSKPKKEAWAAGQLSRADIETYLPLVARREPRLRLPCSEPFFPCYFFARLDPDGGEIRLARYTQGVVDVVGYGGQPCPVPDDLINLVRDRVTGAKGRRGGADDFRPGERIVISNGPFRGVGAVFDRHLSSTGRARVLVEMLQRVCSAEIHVSQITRLRQAA